ncbi:MAG: CPBP family intramembrane glutamic endopeptidase, partial [Gemmatimonadota bacterium]
MNVLRVVSLLVGLASLIASVIRARDSSRFPILVLGRDWLGTRPRRGVVVVGGLAGIASVLVVPVLGQAAGALRIGVRAPRDEDWLWLAAVTIGMKAAFVLFEEAIFRGSLCSNLRRTMPPILAVIVSAVIFAAAHANRTPVGLAILVVDGIGFAAAFLAFGSLWLPLTWHLSKNVAIWLIYGTGTVGLTPGPLRVDYVRPGWLFGSTGGPGFGDLFATCAVLGLVLAYARAVKRTGPCPELEPEREDDGRTERAGQEDLYSADRPAPRAGR